VSVDPNINKKTQSKWPKSGSAIFKARERDNNHIVSAYLKQDLSFPSPFKYKPQYELGKRQVARNITINALEKVKKAPLLDEGQLYNQLDV